MSQLHKRFTSEQFKELLDRYLKNEIEGTYECVGVLGCMQAGQENECTECLRVNDRRLGNGFGYPEKYHKGGSPTDSYIQEILPKKLLMILIS